MNIDVLCFPPPSVSRKGVFYKLRDKERSREWVCFLVCRAFMMDSFLRFAFVSFVNHISHCASSFNFHKYMSRKSKLTPIQSTPHTKRRYRQHVVLWRHLLTTRICSLNYIREIITGLEHAQSRKQPESCIFWMLTQKHRLLSFAIIYRTIRGAKYHKEPVIVSSSLF